MGRDPRQRPQATCKGNYRMSKYYTVTENSRGNEVTAGQNLFARAKVMTLNEGFTKFHSGGSAFYQTQSVTVTLERFPSGNLVLNVDTSYLTENATIIITGVGDKINIVNDKDDYPSVKAIRLGQE